MPVTREEINVWTGLRTQNYDNTIDVSGVLYQSGAIVPSSCAAMFSFLSHVQKGGLRVRRG